jgi:protein gp37
VSDKTSISWTDATWNPIRGCSRVSAGCRNCYAETMAARFCGPGQPYEGLAKMPTLSRVTDFAVESGPELRVARWTGEVRMVPEHLADPLRWKRPRRIFVNSMSDLFHEKLSNEQIAAVFGVMAASPWHTFQVLTKRAKRMREWFAWADARGDHGLAMYPDDPADWRIRQMLRVAALCAGVNALPQNHGGPWPLPNVWIGVSVENQAAADERIPDLLATPAAVRFLSCEPLIGPVDIAGIGGGSDYLGDPRDGDQGEDGIDWVIAGCESGPRARPCDVAWLRSLRDQCAAAGCAFFLKQAKYIDGPRGTRSPIAAFPPLVYEGPTTSKYKPGGIIELPYLDGVRHVAFPAVKP